MDFERAHADMYLKKVGDCPWTKENRQKRHQMLCHAVKMAAEGAPSHDVRFRYKFLPGNQGDNRFHEINF